jgi:glucose/arabinose dehydrogenase
VNDEVAMQRCGKARALWALLCAGVTLSAAGCDSDNQSRDSQERDVRTGKYCLSAPGLTVGYALDEGSGLTATATDASPAHVTGRLTSDSLWGDGRFGKGLVLTGGNAYVDLGNPDALHITGSLSVSAWIKSSVQPVDDAVVVSKREITESGFQLDTTRDTGMRTVGFKLTSPTGDPMYRYGATPLQANTWYHVTGVFDAQAREMHVYLNGMLDDGMLTGTVANAQGDSSQNVTIGRRPGVTGFEFIGSVDEVRLYSRALTAAEALADSTTSVGDGTPNASDAGMSPATPTTPMQGFQNEILATGLTLPTCLKFLPDGRMLVAELAGKILVLPAPYTQPDAKPFLALTNVGIAGVQQGIYDFAFDPDFAKNHYYYVFYTAGTPNHDRLSRFTADALLTGTDTGSERILYEDPQDAHAEHHGGAIVFGNDGMLYFTTGEAFDPPVAQSLSSPRGKLHRMFPDGTAPNDNPFFDGDGPNVDTIWALGLRNPYRAFYDAPSGRLYIGDVGGNDKMTSLEELNQGEKGANYGWPDCEKGDCGKPLLTAAVYDYPHSGRDACITGGFVYHGKQFPSSYVGSYFFADYTQNWIRRLTFDANGNVDKVYNVEPEDGSADGPYGDIVYLAEGPEGALYYVDLGYSDVGEAFGISKIRRIRYIQNNETPKAVAAGKPLSGPTPLTVTFSSAGSGSASGQAVVYAWDFGDGTTSSEANPQHIYTKPGAYVVRLKVSNGAGESLASPLAVTAGTPPTVRVTSPADGSMFVAGDKITFEGAVTGDDADLPLAGYTWNIDFMHDGHVHPFLTMTGVKSGEFTIPTSEHDFSGDTRYRITLTVADASKLMGKASVSVWPSKVALTFTTSPEGLTIYLDGIARPTPLNYDTVPNYVHTLDARDVVTPEATYKFLAWSDAGERSHTIVVPEKGANFSVGFTPIYGVAVPGRDDVAGAGSRDDDMPACQ